ncbi:hypothetical protein CCMA1212_006944 [Trichoderma ghanense]|uniref:Uncharacterized protein n=1 Tax=Trichoderma ghanense TaxID=65468 RepID=A0ABY2GYS4_9HYPO
MLDGDVDGDMDVMVTRKMVKMSKMRGTWLMVFDISGYPGSDVELEAQAIVTANSHRKQIHDGLQNKSSRDTATKVLLPVTLKLRFRDGLPATDTLHSGYSSAQPHGTAATRNHVILNDGMGREVEGLRHVLGDGTGNGVGRGMGMLMLMLM